MNPEMKHVTEEIYAGGEKKTLPLEGLYLNEDLQGLAKKKGRAIVIANYVCDLDDVIATPDEGGEFQVAREVKNGDDWERFQELTAQADVIITGSGYLKRFAKKGEGAENVVSQFDKGGGFEKLGDYRVAHKLKRNPDIVIVSRGLDFDLPKGLFKDGRRIIVCTTYESASNSNPKSTEFKKMGAIVVGTGVSGVNGKEMIDFLSGKMGYKVIKMTTGPRVLKILMDADVLDRLYVTRVDVNIPTPDPAKVVRILVSGGKVADLPNFQKTRSYFEDGIETDAKIKTSQTFEVYERAF